MVPHKTERGKEALKRLKVFEGIPPPYDQKKRVVVPQAMRIMCLKPGRKVRQLFTGVKELSSSKKELGIARCSAEELKSIGLLGSIELPLQ